MSERLIARRYAQALLDAATAKNNADAVAADLAKLAQVVAGAPELQAVLQNPSVHKEERQKIARALFEKLALSDLAARFFLLLIEKGRATLLADAVESYKELIDAAAGRLEAEVRSVRPLGDAAQAALKAQLERSTGKTVRIKAVIDESLLGGVVTRIGSLVFDGSVAGQLNTMKERLLREASR